MSMIEQNSSAIGEAAQLWAILVQDAAFADWDGLTDWLEQDPAHLAAYDAALDADAWAVDTLTVASTPTPVMVAPARTAPLRGRWFAAGGAIAAAVVAVGSWTLLNQDTQLRHIATATGEHRTIDLADGSRIQMNGNTRITIDPNQPRQIQLTQGEALFDVQHDTQHPFVVTANGTRLVDVGTIFNVVHDGDAIDVAVAEGAVDYEAGQDRIRLNPGDGLSRATQQSKPTLRKAAPETIGSWQSGQLQYNDAPLEQIARDLSRNTGLSVRTTSGSANLRFTGTLILYDPPPQIFARAGPLLGVRFMEQGGVWTMVPASVAGR